MCNAALCLPRPRQQPRFAIQGILQLCVAWQGGEKTEGVWRRCSCGGQGGWRRRKKGALPCAALHQWFRQHQQQFGFAHQCVLAAEGAWKHTPTTSLRLPTLLPLPLPLSDEPSVTLLTGHVSHDLVGLVAALIPAPRCLPPSRLDPSRLLQPCTPHD